LPADVALEVAHDLAFGAAFGGAAGDVGADEGVEHAAGGLDDELPPRRPVLEVVRPGQARRDVLATASVAGDVRRR
jgi:hypothetical protein